MNKSNKNCVFHKTLLTCIHKIKNIGSTKRKTSTYKPFLLERCFIRQKKPMCCLRLHF